ncbi:hypothetical protein KFK09_004647 [Dendrobium nobile]|uniref:Retrovirus-related Pol polyprotein from transposon TNT 1-94 n=1 Tax=Dendrobium nobile TaxID=94219 RepID=A0A8T3C3E9_DENNO|nr:hypothetical protein KFK09_004647 [Dendrobium nobile]
MAAAFGPPQTPHLPPLFSYQIWTLLDQNLAATLYSIISPNILSYVLSLDHCSDIWETIARRLQSSTRSYIIQLRNKLHHLSMKIQTCPNISSLSNTRLMLLLPQDHLLILKTSSSTS